MKIIVYPLRKNGMERRFSSPGDEGAICLCWIGFYAEIELVKQKVIKSITKNWIYIHPWEMEGETPSSQRLECV